MLKKLMNVTKQVTLDTQRNSVVDPDSKAINSKLKSAWKENVAKEEEVKARVLKKFGKIKTVSSIIISLRKGFKILWSGGLTPRAISKKNWGEQKARDQISGQKGTEKIRGSSGKPGQKITVASVEQLVSAIG